MFFSCNLNPIVDDEIKLDVGDLEFRSACDLNWSWAYSDQQLGSCVIVDVTENGLEGDCENCVLDAYSIFVNRDLALPHSPAYNVGSATTIENSQGQNAVWNPGTPLPSPYGSFSNISSQFLGVGETISFTLHVGYLENVQMCLEYEIDCGDQQTEVYSVCTNLDIYCW